MQNEPASKCRKIMIAVIIAFIVSATWAMPLMETISEIVLNNPPHIIPGWPIKPQHLSVRRAFAGENLQPPATQDVVRVRNSTSPWSQQSKLTASDGASNDQFGAAVSVSGSTIVVGARNDNYEKGSAYVFEKPIDGWSDMTQSAKLTASDGGTLDQFGHAVGISGDTVVVGAKGNNGFRGAVYVFEKPEGGWANMTETAKLTASDAAASDVFGTSVAVSGDTVVVGAPGDADYGYKSGSAYIFVKPANGWADMTQTAKLSAGYNEAYDDFGRSVAISGDTAVVGADGDDINYAGQGSAYIFVRPAGGWIDMNQTARLIADDAAELDFLGAFVSISADTVVVGAPNVDITNGVTYYDVGRAYVFEKPAGGWTNMTQTARLTADDGVANDELGCSVAISGDTAVIGAWGNDGYVGSAYVFEKPDGQWSDMTQSYKLMSADGAAWDQLGLSVGISQNTVVAGAHLDDDNGGSSGSAYVFQKLYTVTIMPATQLILFDE